MEANPASTFTVEDSAAHSTISDLDGNRVQAVYTGLVCRPETITGQFTLILNPQQDLHVCQVLDSNTYTIEPCIAENVNGGASTKDAPKNQGSVEEEMDSTQANAESANTPSGGISTVLGALMGVAAGAAAGAAITYGVMSARTPEVVSKDMDRRQSSLPKKEQASNACAISAGLVDRNQHKPIPLRPHRIKFQEDQSTTLKKPSTRPTASVRESGVLQSRRKNIEYNDREGNGKQLVRISKDVEPSPVKSNSSMSTSAPSRNASSTRRLALPPPANSSSETRTKITEDQLSEKEHETFVSAHSRVSSSATPSHASKNNSDVTKAAASSAPKCDHSNDLPNKSDSLQKGSNEKSPGSKRSSEQPSKERVSLKSRSTTQLTELSQRSSKAAHDRSGTNELFDTRSHVSAGKTDLSASRNSSSEDKRSRVSAKDIPLPSSRVGTSEFFDTRSHVSAGKTDLSASRNNSSEDKRSRVSAKDIPLPSSRVGTSEFFDTVSHVSTRKAHSLANHKDTSSAEDSRSHISARNIPLPASCVDCGSRVADRNSHVSARNIPLPASCVGTNFHDGSRSHISARNVPLPGSHVGSSRANWDDDVRSIAPSDSISCIGSK